MGQGVTSAARPAREGCCAESQKLLRGVGRGLQTKGTANANAETQRPQRAGWGGLSRASAEFDFYSKGGGSH